MNSRECLGGIVWLWASMEGWKNGGIKGMQLGIACDKSNKRDRAVLAWDFS